MPLSLEIKKELKPYVRPSLTVHGDVAAVTRATTNQGTKDNYGPTASFHRTQ